MGTDSEKRLLKDTLKSSEKIIKLLKKLTDFELVKIQFLNSIFESILTSLRV